MRSTDAEDLRQRTKRFALRIVKLSQTLSNGKEARVLGDQLLRAGTAVAQTIGLLAELDQGLNSLRSLALS